MRVSRLTPLLVLLFSSSCSSDTRLRATHVPQPDYPMRARFENIQGVVPVHISIGSDGKVIFAKGSEAHPILVQAAEDNAREWVFGPFPSVVRFPIDHTITYVFRLEGKPLLVAVPPTVQARLPDRVEIIAVPMVSDYPPIEDYKPIPKAK